MGSGAPLLDEYKQDFFLKRLPQTAFGGLKLKLGYSAPCYVYAGQITVFMIPWILGGVFTALVEYSLLKFDDGSYIYGNVMCIFVLVCQILSTILRERHSRLMIKEKEVQFLNEEDEVEFESCCGSETVPFIITPKKYKVNILIHAVISGVMCGMGLWYLLPTTLNSLYSGNTGVTAVLYALGWFTVCIAQYPLTTSAPPEVATFRALDRYELSPLMRAFYVLLLQAVFLISERAITITLVDQILHVVFVCLPVIWLLGFLPPLDALFFWAFEQILVVFLGGSPTASDLWTVLMVVLSSGVVFAVYFIPVCTGSVVVAVVFGYILSTDLGGEAREVFKRCTKQNKVSSSQTFSPADNTEKKISWPKLVLYLCYHFSMIVFCVTVSLCLLYYKSALPSNTWLTLGYIIIGVLVIEKLIRESQGVYLFFGMWRNKLYPSSLYARRKGPCYIIFSKAAGMCRRILVNFVAPVLMTAYLSTAVNPTDPCQELLTMQSGVWISLTITRAFRSVWQSTVNSLLDISIVHVLMVTLPYGNFNLPFGHFQMLFIVSFIRDRLNQILNKLWFVVALLIKSWADKKQRRKSTIGIIIGNILLSPFVLAAVVISAVFSAPMLPLFTLPIFLFGFPRPLRSWPNAVGASANSCADTVFYRQLSKNLASAMKTAFANGSLGEPQPGNHYLVRFQDRMIWVMVLERGAAYCTLSIKGLELQETSCHTIEAQRVDDIFDSTFESENGFSLCTFNKFPLHTLTPCDAVSLKTYSDARNVLTGIIDSKENQDFVFSVFPKVVAWVLLKEVLKSNKDKNGSLTPTGNSKVLKNSTSKESWSNNNNKSQKETVVTIGASNIARGGSPIVQELDDDDEWDDSRPNSAISVKAPKKPSWNTSFQSFSSILSNEDSSAMEMNKVKTKPKQPAFVNLRKSSDAIEELGFGLPVVDTSVKPKQHRLPFQVSGKSGNSICRPVTKLASSNEFLSPQSCHFSLPLDWQELPLEEARVQKLAQDFPSEWYKYVLSNLKLATDKQTPEAISRELIKDEVLYSVYSQLTMVCCQVFDPIGGTVYGSGANRLHKCYRGEVPSNAVLDWLMEDKHLFNLVLQAFRYSFKLMLDQCVLGEITDHEELLEYLEDYDRDWYIGLDTEHDWNMAVLNNKPSLFSMGHTSHQGTYSSRLVSLQDTVVQIGRLNAECVRGQWANLSLELLYLTNDDEERYSIQAHPALLRNLTVQSADPPLGYPIYSSEPTSISLL